MDTSLHEVDKNACIYFGDPLNGLTSYSYYVYSTFPAVNDWLLLEDQVIDGGSPPTNCGK